MKKYARTTVAKMRAQRDDAESDLETCEKELHIAKSNEHLAQETIASLRAYIAEIKGKLERERAERAEVVHHLATELARQAGDATFTRRSRIERRPS